MGVTSPIFGLLSGRISSIALDPADPTGNHAFLGTTGGGLWKSQNAAATAPASIQFLPLTDTLAALTGVPFAGISIGAVSVQPGATGVVLAGLGDPNDALDSYYGAGLLRSTDNGQTWTLIQQSVDFESGLSPQDYWFFGEGFAAIAWSTTSIQTVVAAVSQAYEGTLVHAPRSSHSYQGLYYSQDGGASWHLSQISDLNGMDVQGPQDGYTAPDGNAATAVVWNPVRKVFFAAVRFHGYYQSADGVTWTRLAVQPGSALTTGNCPTQPQHPGVAGCPLFRGSLAVNPSTGDTFAWTVDEFNQDQGIWQDACNLSGNACTNPSISFATQLNTSALEVSDSNGAATIPNGDYNLALAAVPGGLGTGQDTLLFAGANDLWKCSLANSCLWRNTTNTTTCASAAVAPFQHAVAWSLGNPLLVFAGNDSGLWRSTDQVGESGAVCSSSDASHWQNLNASLAGSLNEVEALSQSAATAATMLAGLGANGTAGVVANPSPPASWNQVLDGEGGPVVIDRSTSLNSWYANNAAGVSIQHCTSSTACTPTGFAPAVGEAQVQNDGLTMSFPAEFLIDALDPRQLLVGTCRVWRGPAAGSGWTWSNAMSPVLDGTSGTSGPTPCNGNAFIRSLAAQAGSGGAAGSEVIYAGMAGAGDEGGLVAGHVFSATLATTATTPPTWTDLALSPVVNSSVPFNPAGEDVSSLTIDPHDTTGQTVYVTVSGFASVASPTQAVYRSTDGGAHWAAITSNLPNAPANSLVIDPQDANTVYVATDVGVYVTQAVATCGSVSNCWAAFGVGLPESPVTQLLATATGAGGPYGGQALTAATYGRGIWQIPLLTAGSTVTTATVSPGSLTFAAQTVGTTSAAQTITVKTTGTAPLLVTSIGFSGSSATDFSQTNTCVGVAVAKNLTCTVKVSFTPSASGVRPASLVIAGNSTGGQLLVPVSGTGLGTANVTLLPAGLSFGSIQTGTSAPTQTVSVQNIGGSIVSLTSVTVTAPFTKSASTCGGSLGPGLACAVTVGFVPTATGTFTGTLTVVDGAGTQTAQLTGTAIAGPTDTLSTTSLTFASTVVGQNAPPLPVTITNSGGLPLTNIGTSISGDFTAVNSCGSTLAAGASCAISVTFTPTVASGRAGTLVISDALRAQSVRLSGTGVKPPALAASPSSLSFGSQQINLPSPSRTLTIQNTGGSSLGQPSFALSGPGAGNYQVGVTTCGSSVAAGGSCTVSVTFLPLSVGVTTATLTVATTTVGVASLPVALSGTGLSPPMLGVLPPELDFGPVIVGNSSAILTVQVTNTGQVAMAVPSFALNGSTDFALVIPTDIPACTALLNPNATCNMQVQFSPTILGAQTATLTVTGSNALPPTATVTLTGSGTPSIVLQAIPAQLSFAPTPAGTASPAQTISISNLGRKQANGLTLTLAGPYQFSTVLTTCKTVLAGVNSCTAGIVFTPGVSGDEPGSLTVQVTNLGVPALVVPLDGAGLAVGGLTVSPTQMTFGSVVLATNSALQTLTVTNSGQAPVAGLGLAVAGDFHLSGNTCPPILPGPSCSGAVCTAATCTTGVVFTPSATGSRTASLAVTTTSAGVLPASVALSGNGILAGGLAANPTVVSFGGVTLGLTSPPQTVTVTNASGPGASTLAGLTFAVAGDFSLAQNSCGTQIAPGATCTYSVTFSPSLPGTRVGSVTISSSSPSIAPLVTGLAGTGLPTAQLAVTPGLLNFGSVQMGSNSTPLNLTISNNGTGPLAGLLIQAATPFSVGTGSCHTSLAAGSSCNVPVIYVPTAAGTQNGIVLVSSTSLCVAAVQVGITGTGIPPASLRISPTSLSFPGTTVGSKSAGQSVTIANPGGVALAGLTFTMTGNPDFALGTTSCTSNLAPGASCSGVVTFTPQVAGGRAGFLIAASSTAGVANSNTSLSGTGLTPAALSFTPGQLTFAATLLGQASATQTVTLANTGQSPIADLRLTLTSGFALDPAQTTCTVSLAGGATCLVGIDFAPTSGGPATGTLTASSAASAPTGTTPATASLAGVGALPPAILTSPAALVAFATTGVHVTADPVSVTVTNPGTLSALTGLSLAIDATGSAAGFGLSGSTCGASLNPGASCTVNVTFTPTLAGKLTGALNLTSSNGGTAMLALGGIGFDFRFALQGAGSAAVIAGQSASYTLTLNPLASSASGQGSAGGPYSFQCANLPANTLCAFNPGQLPGLPANVTGNDILSITTVAPAGPTPSLRKGRHATLFLVSVLALFPLRRRMTRLRNRKFRPILGVLLLGAFAAVGITSCATAGGSSGQFQRSGGTPPGTYTVTVTASSTGVAHSLSVQLVVN